MNGIRAQKQIDVIRKKRSGDASFFLASTFILIYKYLIYK